MIHVYECVRVCMFDVSLTCSRSDLASCLVPIFKLIASTVLYHSFPFFCVVGAHFFLVFCGWPSLQEPQLSICGVCVRITMRF